MFHFGLPSEPLDFQDEPKFIKRFNKLLYIGSGTDPLPLPIAKNAVYVDASDINMKSLVKEVKRRFQLLEEPKIEYSQVQGTPMAIILFKWGSHPGLTR